MELAIREQGGKPGFLLLAGCWLRDRHFQVRGGAASQAEQTERVLELDKILPFLEVGVPCEPRELCYILCEHPEGTRPEEQFAIGGQGEAAAEGSCDSTI